MRRLLPLLLLLAPIGASAADKPVPPSEAAAKFTLPKGFSATLFAGEPDIVQPIAFTFDTRGRMWVVECLSYPKWSQDGKGGKDRVTILEDTDGDGKFDKKTVVIDDGVNLSGIELGFGGVYLCSSPNFIFVPIKDDKPSGKPEILLDGWNIKEAKHNVFNSLIWGPDGWLYGCNGIQTKSYVGRLGTDKKDRTFFDCGVWRFHPTKKQFEVVANGTTNPFGLDFDEHGEMFITNCVIDHLWHVVPGGHYQRMYGTDPNPNVYGHMTSAVDYKHWGSGAWTDSRADQKTGALKKEHDDAGGGHAHSGAAIYLGENFPKEYRNTLFTCNIHGNRLNNDGLERTKTGMKGVRRPDFQFANDPWFRGICVKVGPDGGLYTSDWSDTGECHNYDKADITNGRIYRTIYGDQKGWKGDVAKLTTEELVVTLYSQNEWLGRQARRVLQERGAGGEDVAKAILGYMWDQDKPIFSNYERRIWALAAVEGLTRERYSALRKSDHSGRWLLQFGVEARIPQALAEFQVALENTESIADRLKLAAIFQKMAIDMKLDMYPALLGKPIDSDPNLAWMLWFAIEPMVASRPQMAFENFDAIRIPLVRQNLIRRYLSLTHKDEAAAMLLLSKAIEIGKNDAKRDILLGIREAYADRPKAKALPGWSELPLSAGVTADVRAIADELSVKFGDAAKIGEMKERILQPGESADARISAIRQLAGAKVEGLTPLLIKALADDKVRGAALRALAAYPDDKTADAILKVYPKLTAEEKADAVQTLAARVNTATELLDAVEKGSIPKADITAFTARQITVHKDAALLKKLASVWGEVKPASATRTAQIKRYKELLTPDAMKSADASSGRAIFTRNCATCHKLFGEGQAVGPELTGAQRGNLDYILENVVDPSAVVANEYKMHEFQLLDGRVVTGIVKRETPQAVTVRTVNEELVIVVKDIEKRKPTQNSVMPEGLFDAMKPEEVRDLVAYLMGREQVPLPK
jgi:putative membrane-bound dehydrogenase-like protein